MPAHVNTELRLDYVCGRGSESVKNMDDEKPYKVVLAGRYGVGKSRIFEQLQYEVDGSMRGMQTVEVGTGTGRSNREKWMVRVSLPSCGRDVTVMVHSYCMRW